MPEPADYEAILTSALATGLANTRSIVLGQLSIHDRSRRNCNIEIVMNDGRSLFLKQDPAPHPLTRDSQPKYASVGYEASVYGLLSDGMQPPQFSQYLPKVHACDSEVGLLVLEALDGSSLRALYGDSGQIPVETASELGRAVGHFHDPGRYDLESWRRLRDVSFPPWLNLFPVPTEATFWDLSAANLTYLGLLSESSSLCANIEQLTDTWTSSTTVIHADFKWENCLVLHSSDAMTSGTPELRIVDWELATLGDPACDIGTAFAEYLNCWLSSVPITSIAEPGQYLDLATAPLESMHESIVAFWSSYVATRRFSSEEVTTMLLRSCRNAGARLVQIGYEEQQYHTRLTAKAILLLQLAENILSRPAETAVRLLGIPIPSIQTTPS